jgi:hypothetical protein
MYFSGSGQPLFHIRDTSKSLPGISPYRQEEIPPDRVINAQKRGDMPGGLCHCRSYESTPEELKW